MCPCEINLGCDVDDVVASDLLPKIDRKSKGEVNILGEGNLNLFSQINRPQSEWKEITLFVFEILGYFHQINFLSAININVNRGPRESVLKR